MTATEGEGFGWVWGRVAAGKSAGRGFTLIEMLVVIAIISILAALLLPTLQRAQETALAVSCTSNLRQVGDGVALYQDQYGGFLPPYRFIFIPVSGSVQARGFASGIAACLELPKASDFLTYLYVTNMDENGDVPNFTNRQLSTVFRCGADPYPDPSYSRNYPSSYGINQVFATDVNYLSSRPWKKLSGVRSPSYCAFVGDTTGYYLNRANGRSYEHEIFFPGWGNWSSRHSGNGNGLFLDGHVQAQDPAAIPLNPNDRFWVGKN